MLEVDKRIKEAWKGSELVEKTCGDECKWCLVFKIPYVDGKVSDFICVASPIIDDVYGKETDDYEIDIID